MSKVCRYFSSSALRSSAIFIKCVLKIYKEKTEVWTGRQWTETAVQKHTEEEELLRLAAAVFTAALVPSSGLCLVLRVSKMFFS